MEKIWFDESICLRAAKLSDAPAMFRMIDTQRQGWSDSKIPTGRTGKPKSAIGSAKSTKDAAS